MMASIIVLLPAPFEPIIRVVFDELKLILIGVLPTARKLEYCTCVCSYTVSPVLV
jgi:hypothetical protein